MKFKAWNSEQKKMYHEWGVESGLAKVLWTRMFNEVTEEEALRHGYSKITKEDWYDKIVFLQFTGVCDKKNVPIYNGDILKWEIFDGLAYFGGTDAVYFQDGAFRLNKHHPVIDYIDEDDEGDGNVEVIGNIYEHPELLGVIE